MLDRGDGVRLAYRRQPGKAPTLVWMSGYRSDMDGNKAEALAAWAAVNGQAYLRFDYSGHGRSDGAFEDQGIEAWLSDSLQMIDKLTEGPLVLVGSSMGGWLALLAAKARPERVKALLLIAPAWDMTARLMHRLPPEARDALAQTGRWEVASPYGGTMIYTAKMIAEGDRHLLGDAPYEFAGSVRILQGAQDPDVPAAHAEALRAKLRAPDVRLHLVPDGDHRLSRAQDLALLTETAAELSKA